MLLNIYMHIIKHKQFTKEIYPIYLYYNSENLYIIFLMLNI